MEKKLKPKSKKAFEKDLETALRMLKREELRSWLKQLKEEKREA